MWMGDAILAARTGIEVGYKALPCFQSLFLFTNNHPEADAVIP